MQELGKIMSDKGKISQAPYTHLTSHRWCSFLCMCRRWAWRASGALGTWGTLWAWDAWGVWATKDAWGVLEITSYFQQFSSKITSDFWSMQTIMPPNYLSECFGSYRTIDGSSILILHLAMCAPRTLCNHRVTRCVALKGLFSYRIKLPIWLIENMSSKAIY